MLTSEIHNIDCLEFMREMPDKSVYTLADPPYGINMSQCEKLGNSIDVLTNYHGGNWDKEKLPKIYFDEIKRISIHYVVWGANYYKDYFDLDRGLIYWRKGQPQGIDFASGELAVSNSNFSFKEINVSYTKGKNNVSNNKRKAVNCKIHQCQKPIQVYNWFFRPISEANQERRPALIPEGSLVFDPFCGSGTSRIAAYLNGCHFVGCEIDPVMVEKSQELFDKIVHGVTLNGAKKGKDKIIKEKQNKLMFAA